ncbi:TPA: hypothetical protein RFY31_004944 [Klebsiella aerogenes]|nr:hypothetical protein [Klebsiella aerogenes]HDU6305166.1 hypothetical protein [Klebsiella aerogenes]
MKNIKIKAPPLFGVTKVNDIYCDISRNLPRSEWLGVVAPLLLSIPFLTLLICIIPIIKHTPEILFMSPLFLFMLYCSMHALRIFISRPKTMMVRLNRKRQKIYVQKHCHSYNLFAKWPVKTLVFDWHNVTHPSFRNGSGTAGSRTWYSWHISSPKGEKTRLIISDDNIPLFFYASRYFISIEDTIISYAESWQWCNDYMNGINSPVTLLTPPRATFKYCVTTLSNRLLSRVDDSDRWTTIFPIRNPFFWLISFLFVPIILIDALALRSILRRLPDTPLSEITELESTTEH